jgi:hypothetical protein
LGKSCAKHFKLCFGTMTWRKPIFKKGRSYRVKQSVMSGASTFVVGEDLVFLQDGYSHYDNCFVYEFRSQSDGQSKNWCLNPNQPETFWQQIFEPMDERDSGA